MDIFSLDTKGRITIPKQTRDSYGWDENTNLEIKPEQNSIKIKEEGTSERYVLTETYRIKDVKTGEIVNNHMSDTLPRYRCMDLEKAFEICKFIDENDLPFDFKVVYPVSDVLEKYKVCIFSKGIFIDTDTPIETIKSITSEFQKENQFIITSCESKTK